MNETRRFENETALENEIALENRGFLIFKGNCLGVLSDVNYDNCRPVTVYDYLLIKKTSLGDNEVGNFVYFVNYEF